MRFRHAVGPLVALLLGTELAAAEGGAGGDTSSGSGSEAAGETSAASTAGEAGAPGESGVPSAGEGGSIVAPETGPGGEGGAAPAPKPNRPAFIPPGYTDAGCSCATVGASVSTSPLAWLSGLALGGAALRRRSRRRR